MNRLDEELGLDPKELRRAEEQAKKDYKEANGGDKSISKYRKASPRLSKSTK